MSEYERPYLRKKFLLTTFIYNIIWYALNINILKTSKHQQINNNQMKQKWSIRMENIHLQVQKEWWKKKSYVRNER